MGQAELTEFLFVLYCIVQGVDECLGCKFAPAQRFLRRRMEYKPSGGYGATRVYRGGGTWLRVFEREFDGRWPAWWDDRRNGAEDCIRKRELLQLKVLLARMVLNHGADSLAIACLCSSGRDESMHSMTESFAAAVYSRMCLRCKQPYSQPSAEFEIPSGIVHRNRLPETMAQYEEHPGRWEFIEHGQYWRFVFKETCEHDPQPGYLIQHICRLSPFALNLWSAEIVAHSVAPQNIPSWDMHFGAFVTPNSGLRECAVQNQHSMWHECPKPAFDKIHPYQIERDKEEKEAFDRDQQQFRDRFAQLPRVPDIHAPDWSEACRVPRVIRPKVTQFEPLLQWAEAFCSLNHGILPPYMREGFASASVVSSSKRQTAPPASCPAETSGSEDDQLDIPPLQAQSDSDAAEDVECVPCDPSYADEPVDDPGEFPW